MIFVIFILLLYYCYFCRNSKYYNNKINEKCFTIIKNFCHYQTNDLINVISLLGDNKKTKAKYTKIIANLYKKKIINCNLYKLRDTNDIKELFFHKDIISINNKLYNIPINKRLYVFNLIDYQEYKDYSFEISNIIKLLNFFTRKTKFVFVFIINDNNQNDNNKNKNNNHLYISLNKNSYNSIRYFYNNRFTSFYF
jgi:hypothetical protein